MMLSDKKDAEYQIFVPKLVDDINGQLDQGKPQLAIQDDLVRKGYPTDFIEELVKLIVAIRWTTPKESLNQTVVAEWTRRNAERIRRRSTGWTRMKIGFILILISTIIALTQTLYDSGDPVALVYGVLLVSVIYFFYGVFGWISNY